MINNVIINSTETTILECPIDLSYAAVTLFFCNTSSSNEVITVYAVKNGDSAGDSNTFLKEVTIPAKDTGIFSDKLLLDSLDKISAIGSTGNRVSCTVSFITL